MTRLRVESFTISLDGFGAGPDQSLDNPLGVGGTAMFNWAFATRTFQQTHVGGQDGETGVDDDFAIAPVLLGSGKRLFEGLNLPALGYACSEHVATSWATHVVFSRQ